MNHKKYRSKYKVITVPTEVYDRIIELKKELDNLYNLNIKIYSVISAAIDLYRSEVLNKNKKVETDK